MAEAYKCMLNDKTLSKAKKELHEDPKNRMGAVQTLREWLVQQPHLHCNTGQYDSFTYCIKTKNKN